MISNFVRQDRPVHVGKLEIQDGGIQGRAVIEQGETACCYAKSEKSWISDPAGLSWETFHTTGQNIRYGDGRGENDARIAKACCVPSTAADARSACCTASS